MSNQPSFPHAFYLGGPGTENDQVQIIAHAFDVLGLDLDPFVLALIWDVW